MCCKYKNIVHRHRLYVAKTYIICCKDIYYMMQREKYMLQKQHLYVIKAILYVVQKTFICYKGKIYML